MPASTSKASRDLAVLADNGSITVRNNLSTIAVLAISVNGESEPLEFGPLGSRDGTDIQELPGAYLRNSQFRKQLNLGIYEVIDADDPAVLEAVENQKSTWAAQQQAKSESDRFIQAQQPKSFSGRQCLALEGRNQCSEYAIFAANNHERPPLCSKHAHLASQFFPEETGTFTENKPDIQWNRVGIY